MESWTACLGQAQAAGTTFTSIVIDAVGLHQCHADGPSGGEALVLAVQIILPAGSFTLVVEVLVAALVGEIVVGIIFAAKHGHPVDAVVANSVVCDVRETG